MESEMTDVIVVDDNPALVNVLSEILKESGYVVRTASDGFAALASIRERMPHILISDLNMPRMSGFELLSIVRRRFPSVAVIAMSGAYSGVVVPQGIAADAFYAKGSSSVGRLFEIVDAIKDDATRGLSRAAAPIWIPRAPIDQEGFASVAVACPECLRTFLHYLNEEAFSCVESYCPHCHNCMRLAVAEPTADVDRTGFGLRHTTRPASLPAYHR